PRRPQAAYHAAAGTLAGNVPAAVGELTQGALKTVSLNKLHVAVVALVGAAIVGTVGFYYAPTQAAPAPVEKAKPSGGVIVLDDCDPEFKGKSAYEDNLTFLAASGKLRARVSGLNVCEEIGSPNRVAIDVKRKRVWVAETVGKRLL